MDIVEYAQKAGLYVTILSNGENFSNETLIKEMKNKIYNKKLRVITTLHSQNSYEHEAINGVKGSFQRSIKGLKNIYELGAKIEIKHCLTKENIEDLLLFYKYYSEIFPEDVNIQLCGIDYIGIKKNKLKQEFLSAKNIKKNLEELFEYYLKQKKLGSKRKLYAINIPLCACDPYYWSLMSLKKDRLYNGYTDPYSGFTTDVQKNVGVDSRYCSNCKVYNICNGTYKTAFDYFGSELVTPFI